MKSDESSEILNYAHDGRDGAEVLVTRGGGHAVTLDNENIILILVTW